ncbi:MAG: TolC family protein [Acidobacteriia bacterium]|nr:TolC family protein [Terriglobia bacterium]
MLAAQELLQAQQNAVASQQKHLAQVRSFYQAGTRPKIDVTNQELALARSQVDLRQAQANLDVARAALATAMGIPIQQAPEPVEALEESREPDTLDKLLAEAEQNRPDIAASRDQLFAA